MSILQLLRIVCVPVVVALMPAPGAAQPLEAPAVPPEARNSPLATLESTTGERASEPREELDEIETDRDSFTPATSTVGRRRLIVESAYTFSDNRGIKETHSFPELLLRYGLTDRIELRLGWNYEVGGEGSDATGIDAGEGDEFASSSRLVREHSLAYGVKLRISDQDRWIPRSSLILQGFTPTGGSAGTSPATQIVSTYTVGWELPNRWRFDAAMRYGTASEAGDRFNQWAPSAVLRVPFRDRWAIHVEYFSIISTGAAENPTKQYFSPGLHYLVNPNLEFGFRLGWGLNEQSSRFFANAGVGWRY